MGNPESTVIGFVIAETLDERTINDQTVQVRIGELGELPIEGDIVHSSYQIFNFCPKEPLLPDKTYEVTLVQDGIKDVAGNGIDEFVFHFSTGNSLVVNNKPKIHSISYGDEIPVQIGQRLTFSMDASDEDNDPLEYRWDFNDGNGNTAWSSSNTISYTYTEKGVKKINVQVRDDKGGVAASARGVVVIEGSPGPAPVHSGPLALDPNTRNLVVVNPDNNTVAFINPDSMVKTGEYPVSADPRSVTIDNYGKIWVACMDDNVVDVLNSDGSLNVSIGLGRGCMPFGILASPDGTNVYVAEQATGEITKIDASTNTVVDSIYVGKIPGLWQSPGMAPPSMQPVLFQISHMVLSIRLILRHSAWKLKSNSRLIRRLRTPVHRVVEFPITGGQLQ
jgi:YVTN family beta-propeller protein